MLWEMIYVSYTEVQLLSPVCFTRAANLACGTYKTWALYLRRLATRPSTGPKSHYQTFLSWLIWIKWTNFSLCGSMSVTQRIPHANAYIELLELDSSICLSLKYHIYHELNTSCPLSRIRRGEKSRPRPSTTDSWTTKKKPLPNVTTVFKSAHSNYTEPCRYSCSSLVDILSLPLPTSSL